MIHRTLGDRIKSAAGQMPIISITGPRQSGKTTLCRALFPSHFYANLEDPETRAFALNDPKQFLRQGQRAMIIDEAQYAPELFSHLQVIADESGKNGEYILSASQNFLLMEKITQSLAGRIAIFHLLPLSLEELKPTSYSPDNPFDFILNGGYPRIYDQQVDLNVFYPSYIQTYVERDVRQLLNISDLQQFQLFTKICAGRIGQLFNQNAIANDTGLTRPTVKRWFSILQTGFIAYTLPPYFRNFNKRLTKMPKLYFYDTGLACYLLGIRSAEELKTHYAKGALFENFVINEVLKSFYNNGEAQQLYFWRDKTGREIDLLIDTGGKLHPIEIKAGQTISAHFFKSLNYFNKISDNNPALSSIVYSGELNQKRTHGQIVSWDNLTNLILT